MVRAVIDIPDELVHDIEDIMNTYELTIDELVVTAIRRLVKKRAHQSGTVSAVVTPPMAPKAGAAGPAP